VLPDGHPVFLKENSRKCYRLITKHYCIDGGDIGDPNRGFSNDEEQIFLATCSELLYEPPVSASKLEQICDKEKSSFFWMHVLI
jgi:hypothetical protein